jgi:hypothetical protein
VQANRYVSHDLIRRRQMSDEEVETRRNDADRTEAELAAEKADDEQERQEESGQESPS